MNLHYLEYIVATAKHHSFSKAAEELHVSQPTLSLYLMKLEEELKLKLFMRDRNSFVITEAGQMYVDAAIQILEIKENLYQKLYFNESINIKLGISSSNTPMILPLIDRFKQAYQNPSILPVSMPSRDLISAITNHSIDMAITSMPLYFTETLLSNITYQVIQEYELTIAITKRNPIYKKLNLENGILDPENYPLFNEIPFIQQQIGISKAKYDKEILKKLGISPKRMMDINDPQFIPQFLLMEDAFCLIPFSEFYYDGVELIRFHNAPRLSRIIMYEKGKLIRKPELALIDLILSIYGKEPYYYYI